MKKREIRKTYEETLVQGERLKNVMYGIPQGKPIKNLKKGSSLITGGGKSAVITGHKTITHVQIQLESGEYDWISKDAIVEENKPCLS